jgi:VanZ family protein
VFAVAVALSLIVLFAPQDDVPNAPPGVDKVVHLLMFLGLAASGALAGATRRWLALSLVAYAVASEIIQASPLIGRSASVLDALADIAGIALGLFIASRAARYRKN